MEVQERIKQLMNISGWTEYRLAKESGLSQSTISHLFKRNNAPTFPTILAICKGFGITLGQFFAGEGEAVVLTSEQMEILLLWGTLSEEQKESAKSVLIQFNKL